MLSLRELQREMRAALLGGDGAILAAEIEPDDAEGVAVHVNNVTSSLTAVLAGTFPVVEKLVDGRFFAYAARTFLCEQPPARPRLAEYGTRFADFLEGFPPCRELVYLADVARLEWALHRAANAARVEPIAIGELARRSAHAELSLVLDPSVFYLASRYPVEAIWRANRGSDSPETIDLDAGGVRLEILRRGADVMFRALEPATFAFRATLASGAVLGAAAEAALRENAQFDLAASLAALFHDGVVAAVA